MQSFTAIPSWPQSIILPAVSTGAGFVVMLLNLLWWIDRADSRSNRKLLRLFWISLFGFLSSLVVVIVTIIPITFRRGWDNTTAAISSLYLLVGLSSCLAVSDFALASVKLTQYSTKELQ